jgi:hypothetical protein
MGEFERDGGVAGWSDFFLCFQQARLRLVYRLVLVPCALYSGMLRKFGSKVLERRTKASVDDGVDPEPCSQLTVGAQEGRGNEAKFDKSEQI